MTKINLLSESVYNLISAGEVVENPASVVKELVENAIDAGADSVSVSIEDGGIKSIVVTDNGCGMEKEDLPRAILPHATSKISTAQDLAVIGTLGFRGEALASISAVSETTVASHYFESETGNFITVKGGVVTSGGMDSLTVGTRVTVNNLFYNTPARFAFLKTPKGEDNNVTSTMIELIFSNPDVSFTYVVDGKTVYKTTGEGLYEAIYPIYGQETAANMLPLFIEEKGYKITGFSARPATDAIRGNRTRQIFIVNGRPIEDPTLSAVIQNAYGEHLMKRTFPTVVLDIVMPFDLVDVNVHPNKREVRFADRKVINGLVYNAVKTAVETDAEERQKELFSIFHSEISHEETVSYPLSAEETPAAERKSVLASAFYKPIQNKPVSRQIEELNSLVEEEPSFSYLKSKISGSVNVTTFTLSDSHPTEQKTYRVIGQLFDTYLLIEIGDELIFLDQHATHERILYDKLIEESKTTVAVQDLLLPFDYSVNGKEKDFIKSNLDNFARLGFRMEINGDSVSVYSVPCLLTDLDIAGFLQELIEYNKRFEELSSSSIIKDKIAKIACKRAIKGGDKLTDSQIDYVIDYFFEKGVPLQCPHGRPTMVKMTKTELEKRFGRIV